jgi:hypothetical protein
VHQPPQALDASLQPWARWAAGRANLCFVVDHDRIHLAEGLAMTDAARSAVYQYIGIRMPLLLRKLPYAADQETLIDRLGMLCKFAVQAGVQKREFLRRQQSAFFTGRDTSQMTVVVVPIGLDAVISEMFGKSIAADEAGLGFAEQIVARMLHRLRNEGRYYQLHSLVDGFPGPADWSGDVLARSSFEAPLADPVTVTGSTPAVPGPGPRSQIAAGGKLHAVAACGTTLCRLPDAEPDAEQIVQLIHFAARQTNTCRLRFVVPKPARQPALADEWVR